MLYMKHAATGRGLLEAGPDLPPATGLDISWMVAAVRRRLWSTVLIAMVFAALAVIYVLMRPANYTASTQLQLTNLKLTLGQDDDAVFAEAHSDPTFLETQIAIIRARKIGLAALERIQRVYKDVEKPSSFDWGRAKVAGLLGFFMPGAESEGEDPLSNALTTFLAPDEEETEAAGAREQRLALRRLQEAYTVQRVGLSNIVEISFTAPTPEHAALGANEIAQVYIADQEAARAEFAQSGSIWLRERLRDVGTRTRIISTAAPPLDKSDMRGILIIASACIIGAALGVALSLARQLLDRTVRTAEQGEAASGTECLGIVPRANPCLFMCREQFRPIGLKAEPASAANRPVDFLRKPAAAKIRQVLGNVQAALDDSLEDNGAACIGFTATRECEGVSTMAFAFASFLAAQKQRVLLIDCNPGSRGLSANLAARDREGLSEALSAKGNFSNFMLEGACSGLRFMPYGGGGSSRESSALLRSDAMSDFLRAIKEQFDVVVCDLPSLASIGEVRSAARHLDHFVLVAECGRVEGPHMQAGIKAAGALRGKLLGLILNKARTGEIRAASPGSDFLLLPTRRRSLSLRNIASLSRVSDRTPA